MPIHQTYLFQILQLELISRHVITIEDLPAHLGTRVGVDEKTGVPKSSSLSSSEE